MPSGQRDPASVISVCTSDTLFIDMAERADRFSSASVIVAFASELVFPKKETAILYVSPIAGLSYDAVTSEAGIPSADERVDLVLDKMEDGVDKSPI